MENTLYSSVQYGYIEIHLKELIDSRQICRNALARAIDTRFEVIDKWYKGNVEKMDMDVLARICYALQCNPQDIICYIRNS